MLIPRVLTGLFMRFQSCDIRNKSYTNTQMHLRGGSICTPDKANREEWSDGGLLSEWILIRVDFQIVDEGKYRDTIIIRQDQRRRTIEVNPMQLRGMCDEQL